MSEDTTFGNITEPVTEDITETVAKTEIACMPHEDTICPTDEEVRVAEEAHAVEATRMIEVHRLAKAETQKPQAYRCAHHLAYHMYPREDVAKLFGTFEPEAIEFAKTQIEQEKAVLVAERMEAATIASVANISISRQPKRPRGR